jgi:hypothetical protein
MSELFVLYLMEYCKSKVEKKRRKERPSRTFPLTALPFVVLHPILYRMLLLLRERFETRDASYPLS